MSDLKLPEQMTELRPALARIVNDGQDHAPFFSGFLSTKDGLRITIENREENVVEIQPTAGTVLSAYDGATMYERAVSGFSLNKVEKAARSLVQGVQFEKYSPPTEQEKRGDFVSTMQIDPEEMSVQEKLERCRALHKRFKDRDQRIVNAQVIYIEINEYSVYMNHNADLAQRISRVFLYIIAVVAGPDGQVRYDIRSKSGTGGWEVLDFTDEELQDLVDCAVALLNAERIEPGEYQIITSPGVSGVICHESFGHGVETDMFLKQRARASHFIDEVVASPLVNIFDDPGYQGAYGSYFFDDEGCMSSSTQVVEDGIFRRGITDLYSANALGIPRSANGRRQDYSRKAYARMSNTFFGPGNSTLEEMLAQVEHGIYLDKWSSGMEDPQGWGIQITCHYGYEIKNGRITERMFAPIGISGFVPEVLQSITAVGGKVQLEGGYCGKGHKEIIQTAAGGPHLLLRARLG